jgi:hypothetical protein
MKNLIKLFSFTVGAGFLLASCEGPMGPAGKDGLAGTDANETCKLCHNSTVVEEKATEFEFSKHSYGEAAFSESGSLGCAVCHTMKGFQAVVANSTPATFTLDATSGKYVNNYSAPANQAFGELGCPTCHVKLHTTYTDADFFPLTTTSAVSMNMWAGSKSINLTQDDNKSNLCAKCHQPRPITKSTDGNVIDYASLAANPNTVFYDSTTANMGSNILKVAYRTGVHYGTVGAILSGQGGVEFTGSLSYTNSEHTTVASCVDCHMADVTGKVGGHTFFSKGNFNGCNVTGCHSTSPLSSTATKWTTTRAAYKTLLNTLAGKLKQGGVDLLNRNGDATSNLWAGLTTNNYDGYINVYDPVSNPTGSTYNTSMFRNPSTTNWTPAQIATNNALPKLYLKNVQFGALINFQLGLREYSLGVHNNAYSTALIQNSIDALTLAGF